MKYTVTRLFAPLLAIIIVSGGIHEQARAEGKPSDAAKLAMEAYNTIDEHAYENAYLRTAYNKINEAGKLDAKEPMVYAAMANFLRVSAYKVGAWHDLDSYQEGALDQMRKYTDYAVTLPRQEPEAHIMLARTLIIQQYLDKAAAELEKAREMGGNMYKYHRYSGTVSMKKGELAQARSHLDKAVSFASTPLEKSKAFNDQLDMAWLQKDYKAAEALHHKIIENDPTPQSNGNYGWFLISMKRCDEAVKQFDKTLAMGRYPNAEQGLAAAQKCLGQ